MAANVQHADQRYIEGLLQNKSEVITEIYERFSQKVKGFVVQNSGSVDDAADIFQEALVDIYNQAKYKQLILTCPFEPYLLLICKRKWLNELKKRGRKGVTIDIDEQSTIGEDTFKQAEDTWHDMQQAHLFKAMFEQLGDRCREIIQLSLGTQSQEEIASALGVTYGYLRKKKSECMAALIAAVKSNAKKWGI
ncbi:RNA polymerase sigma factor (sigma-70 family) [Chitinophaga skermanii]|uniref:RNA polymerase sigma factor (Sigma-70 family) n=1 Tax=Chitinophaga skermanii TaxID=331697 RepID=A0A327RAM6_9BACT|nr:RNA polymerase sigma factor [Chitinophaga skermanii]RAJ10977.1 RNA polymerase sigma factor (sigma-70 family) [Chitinophaga skermanii]